MSGKFELFLGKNEQFYFHLKATNGEIILKSEGYTTKANCHNGIKSVQVNCVHDKSFDKKVSAKGKPYFNLKASNGQVIGTSEQYESEQSCMKGIDAVKKNGAGASVVDLTLAKK